MSVTRPVNSSGVETIQMPELSSLPDTSPVQLSIWLNRCFNSLAHMHNNGSQTAPAYIDEGGVWARPLLDGTQALVRQGGVNRELWYTDANGLCLPFGYTKAMGDASDLNTLIDEGMFHFTATTSNIPTGFTGGTVWVQRSRRSATSTVHNQLIISDSAVMCYRTGFSGGTVASLSWGDWRYLQYETAVPTVIPGAIIAFDGAFGGQSNRYPINTMTGKVDISYAICDGAAHTTEDGRTVTTPDLTNRFIKGSAPAGVGQTGGGSGTASVTTTIGGTTLSLANLPYANLSTNIFRTRGAAGSTGRVYDGGVNMDVGYDPGTAFLAGSGTAHGHTATSVATLSGIEPTYYTLAYIKKL